MRGKNRKIAPLWIFGTPRMHSSSVLLTSSFCLGRISSNNTWEWWRRMIHNNTTNSAASMAWLSSYPLSLLNSRCLTTAKGDRFERREIQIVQTLQPAVRHGSPEMWQWTQRYSVPLVITVCYGGWWCPFGRKFLEEPTCCRPPTRIRPSPTRVCCCGNITSLRVDASALLIHQLQKQRRRRIERRPSCHVGQYGGRRTYNMAEKPTGEVRWERRPE